MAVESAHHPAFRVVPGAESVAQAAQVPVPPKDRRSLQVAG